MLVTDKKCLETDLVNPQLAHNDVVHRGGDLSPHIVVPAGVELQVNGTWGGTETKGYKRKEISQLLLLPIRNCRPENGMFDCRFAFVILNLFVTTVNYTCSG